MKNSILILLAGCIAAGCNNAATQLKENISGADSVAINYFKGDGTMDTVTQVKIIRDKKSIDEMVDLITVGSVAVKDKCGYDGSVHFFKNDKVVQDVFFTSRDECRQFLFRIKGRDETTKLNDKAKDFLLTIKKDKF